jgi:hypothetical protein
VLYSVMKAFESYIFYFYKYLFSLQYECTCEGWTGTDWKVQGIMIIHDIRRIINREVTGLIAYIS